MNVFRCLDRTIGENLGDIMDMVRRGDDVELQLLARNEIPRLIAAWSELLAQHQPNLRGHCTRCVSGRRWFRRIGGPCEVRVTLHAHLMVSDAAVGVR